MDIDNKLTIITDGVEEEATILFTFTNNDKNYVVFEFDESEEVSAAIFVPNVDSNEGELIDIETEEEWEMIEDALNDYFNELENESV